MKVALRRAFTLVEVLTVVLILGIVGAAATAYIGGRGDLAVAGEARRFVTGVQFAQNLAVAKREPHFVVEQDGWLALYTRQGGSWIPVEHPAGGGRVGIELGGDVFRDDSLFGNRPVLGFDEGGQPFLSDNTGSLREPLADSASVVLRSGDFTLEIFVEPVTGEVSIR